jgi:hypothetical protein
MKTVTGLVVILSVVAGLLVLCFFTNKACRG